MTAKVRLSYTSVTDLLQKAKVNYKGKKPFDVYKRLPDMYDLAEKARMQGDEETQYILLWRWLDSVDWLKKTPEYRDNKTFSLRNERANQVGSGICFIKLIVLK